jgi:DNA-binding transcriptional ArsR family regulator
MKGLRAITNVNRLRILAMLRNPPLLPELNTGQKEVRGLTASAIRRQLRCKQPTIAGHMQILTGAGLVAARKSGRWMIYTRDEERIRQLKDAIGEQLAPPGSAAPAAQRL